MVSGPLNPQSSFGFEGIAAKGLGFTQGREGEAPAFGVALLVGLKGQIEKLRYFKIGSNASPQWSYPKSIRINPLNLATAAGLR
jgi:hypothetical protein